MVMLCTALVIGTVYDRMTERGIEFFESEKQGITIARGVMAGLWALGQAILRMNLLVTFVMLAAGIAMARAAGEVGDGWTKMKPMAMAVGGVTVVLQLVAFALRCYILAHAFDDGANLSSVLYATADLEFALHCIWLLLSLLVLALAIRTKALSGAATHTKTVSSRSRI